MLKIKMLFASACLAIAGACALSTEDAPGAGAEVTASPEAAEVAAVAEVAADATEGADAPSRGELEAAASLIDPTPIPLCGDLPNQTFITLESCTLSGQLGTKRCTQTCTIHRTVRFLPNGDFTCVITGSTCGPKSCGPCQVVGPEGPLG